MKTIEQKRSPIITAIIVSLLLHASLVLFFGIKNNLINADSLPIQDEQEKVIKNKTENEWAETKARASSFGAPVLFQDEKEDEKPTPSAHFEPSFAEASEARRAFTTEQGRSISANGSEDANPIKPSQDSSTSAVTQPTLHSDQAPSSVRPEPVEGNDGSKPQSFIAAPSEKKIEKKSPPIIKQPSPIQAPAVQKKLPTLAQLTQGFLNHVKDEGKHSIVMLGKKNGVPSDEQLKYERYLEKLSWCLQNSFSINNDRFPTCATRETTVNILLALNKDGSLHHLSLAQSSGDVTLDQFALFVFKDASASFPPVPHYLPHNPFMITYVVGINTRSNSNIHVYRR